MLLAVVFAWITVTSQLISQRALNKKVHIYNPWLNRKLMWIRIIVLIPISKGSLFVEGLSIEHVDADTCVEISNWTFINIKHRNARKAYNNILTFYNYPCNVCLPAVPSCMTALLVPFACLLSVRLLTSACLSICLSVCHHTPLPVCFTFFPTAHFLFVCPCLPIFCTPWHLSACKPAYNLSEICLRDSHRVPTPPPVV